MNDEELNLDATSKKQSFMFSDKYVYGAVITLKVNEFFAQYAGCGTHQFELTINLDKDELAKLLRENDI